MESIKSFESDHLNLKATELRLGLPGIDDQEKQTVSGPKSNKRSLPDEVSEEKGCPDGESVQLRGPAKAQIVGWPPIRSYRKNSLQVKKSEGETTGPSRNYLKVSRDGAPYLRKIDLEVYNGYAELLKSLESMFKFNLGDYSEREGYGGSEYVPTYEDKDGDWMLVGDVPWEMFMSSCKRLRIMKGPEARGLGCGV